uniref:TSA: Wollemia nobilis Ref_Wollemi_Transcript_1553_1582 transcribed RNA sequence n=1 Tax=Wollemia nobilis TaxID=56998 RepID=A0A0C9S990_9CONI
MLKLAANMEIPWVLAALCMFLAAYAVGFLKIFVHWKLKDRAEGCSCCMSLLHGTPAAVLAAYCMLRSPWELAGQNTPFQNAVMEFSIAYFISDLMHFLAFFPGDFVFIAHHLATLFVMVSCRYFVGHGGFAVMSLLFVAEITSACQNTWTLARIGRRNNLNIELFYEFLSPFFYGFYTAVRGVVAPVLTYNLGRYFVGGKADDVIPRWLACCWMGVVSAAIVASMAWILNLWIELFRGYAALKSRKLFVKTK